MAESPSSSDGFMQALREAAELALRSHAATVLALDLPEKPSGYVTVSGRLRKPRIHRDQTGRHHLATPFVVVSDPCPTDRATDES